MSTFGYMTLDQEILDVIQSIDNTKEEKIRALLRVDGYINMGLDYDKSTEVK